MHRQGWARRLLHVGWIGSIFILVLFLLAASTLQSVDTIDHIQRYTRAYEFNFLSWTMDAFAVKVGQWGLGISSYLDDPDQEVIVLDYIQLVEELQNEERQLEEIIGDPDLEDVSPIIDTQAEVLSKLRSQEADLQPIAESILQEQIATMVSEMGIELIGVPVPPVAFQFSPLPHALIVSPREIIRQDANISLDAEMSLEEKIELESRVESSLDVSALVVPVGGLGTYPTMVQESSSLNWVVEVVAHEWIHNYLSLRPLGVRYNENPELRTMNETTANLMGKEIGRQVLEEHYAFLIPEESPAQPSDPDEPPEFDFRAEMRETRVTVDHLLEQGFTEDAEAYMGARRQMFWERGYRIRRLNQAYFAFHGAYADVPGGAAGDDPVGEAVRHLWDAISDPQEFLRRMGSMTSFDDLRAELKAYPTNP